MSAQEWVTKCWGKTKEITDSPFYSKHELSISFGGYCSLHYHIERANRFIVLEGTVEIIEMFGPKVRRTILGPENIYDVASLVPHMFVVRTSGMMIEEYFADRNGTVRRDDIVRIVEGGMITDPSQIDLLPFSILQDQWLSKTK
jgi:hypothetical protein